MTLMVYPSTQVLTPCCQKGRDLDEISLLHFHANLELAVNELHPGLNLLAV